MLVPTLNKTNENVTTVMGIMFLNNKGIVFRKVNTLMEVRNMEARIDENFLAAAIVMEQKLERLQEIIDCMVDEDLEPIEE